MSHERPACGWYAACRSFFAVPEPLRRRISRQTRAHYWKVHDLPRDLGEDLDRRAAPLCILRWVAWGATLSDQRARHAAAVERRAGTGRWPTQQERARFPRAKPRAA